MGIENPLAEMSSKPEVLACIRLGRLKTSNVKFKLKIEKYNVKGRRLPP